MEQAMCEFACDKIWYQKLRRVNKFELDDKRKTTRRRKYREARNAECNAGASTKCIHRKQKKSRVQVYWLAFYSAELHARGGIHMIHPGLFCSSLRYLSNNVSDGCANSHLQIRNAVHHNHRARANLHISTKRERRYSDCIGTWVTLQQISTRQPSHK